MHFLQLERLFFWLFCLPLPWLPEPPLTRYHLAADLFAPCKICFHHPLVFCHYEFLTTKVLLAKYLWLEDCIGTQQRPSKSQPPCRLDAHKPVQHTQPYCCISALLMLVHRCPNNHNNVRWCSVVCCDSTGFSKNITHTFYCNCFVTVVGQLENYGRIQPCQVSEEDSPLPGSMFSCLSA